MHDSTTGYSSEDWGPNSDRTEEVNNTTITSSQGVEKRIHSDHRNALGAGIKLLQREQVVHEEEDVYNSSYSPPSKI